MALEKADLTGLDDATLIERIGQLAPSTLLVGVTREQMLRIATEENTLGGWLRIAGRKVNEVWNNGQVAYTTPTVKKPKVAPLGPIEVLTSPEETFRD